MPRACLALLVAQVPGKGWCHAFRYLRYVMVEYLNICTVWFLNICDMWLLKIRIFANVMVVYLIICDMWWLNICNMRWLIIWIFAIYDGWRLKPESGVWDEQARGMPGRRSSGSWPSTRWTGSSAVSPCLRSLLLTPGQILFLFYDWKILLIVQIDIKRPQRYPNDTFGHFKPNQS